MKPFLNATCTKVIYLSFITASIMLAASCSTTPEYGAGQVSNPNATSETKALFNSLKGIAQGDGFLFGHQDALAYGIGWWDEDFRTDVNDVCGDHPAVFGWDIGRIGTERNIDSVSFQRMKHWIGQVYSRGGVNTISWHANNPVTGGTPWDISQKAVKHILPGGTHHDTFMVQLGHVANFLADLRAADGTPIPIVFRPYHEHTGHWFWWGETSCTREEYIALWRFTYEYLVNVRGLNNLLWAYSPDRFGTQERYLDRFPGEEYVDILGYDNYVYFGDPERVSQAIRELRIVVQIADSLGKVAALTETGLNMIPLANWWTEHILKPITNDTIAKRIAWVLVWRNANPEHQFAPSPGHPSAPNFMDFYNHPSTLFLNDIPDMYKP